MKVLLFAHLQEEIGQSQIELDWERQTVRAFKHMFQQRYSLEKLDQVMVAVNERYALEEDWIQPGDTVAFIPPVSGG